MYSDTKCTRILAQAVRNSGEGDTLRLVFKHNAYSDSITSSTE
jgi:hypothetical protein